MRGVFYFECGTFKDEVTRILSMSSEERADILSVSLMFMKADIPSWGFTDLFPRIRNVSIVDVYYHKLPLGLKYPLHVMVTRGFVSGLEKWGTIIHCRRLFSSIICSRFESIDHINQQQTG